jgi:ribose/xylose/arabinose/galactoside ABC-type transport system permease subunit
MFALLENSIWGLLLFTYLLFVALKPESMLKPSIVADTAYSNVPLGLLSLAEALVLLSGSFDLSVGQIAGLSAAVGASAAQSNTLPAWALVLVPPLIGLLCGVVNAFLVCFLGLNAFLVTLGTFLVFDGLQLIVNHDVVIDLPSLYTALGESRGLAIGFFLGCLLLTHAGMQLTKWGLRFRASGSNAPAAFLMGINPGRYQAAAFIGSGLFAGLAGLLFTGYSASYSPEIADDAVFMAFAGAVLAGISLTGGKGKIINLIPGVLLLSIIGTGLTVLAVDPYVRRVLFGALVLAAIGLDSFKERVKNRSA